MVGGIADQPPCNQIQGQEGNHAVVQLWYLPVELTSFSFTLTKWPFATSPREARENVWYCVYICVSSKFKFFFLLKLSTVCTFWIVLMCWCQKWFLKNKKTSLACISARKAIWKAPATTLPNTLLIILPAYCIDTVRRIFFLSPVIHTEARLSILEVHLFFF